MIYRPKNISPRNNYLNSRSYLRNQRIALEEVDKEIEERRQKLEKETRRDKVEPSKRT